MLGEPHPAAADATGETYTFEKPVSKVYGGEGFADVWKQGHFAWENKGKKKDLRAAYKQLNDYREDLFNPPLLVVCDLNRFEIHTNFGDTKKRVYSKPIILSEKPVILSEERRVFRASRSRESRRTEPRHNRPDPSPPHNQSLLHPTPIPEVMSTGASQPHREAEWRDPRISPLPLPVPPRQPTLLTSNPQVEALLAAWFDELSAVRILDPACGSGNFLYVALRKLLDLWREARDFAIHHNIQLAITYAIEKMVSPQQLFGIETEFYAHELASVVVWIGFLQWKHENGILEDKEPILQKLANFQHDDAILRYDPQGKPYEPAWRKADFITAITLDMPTLASSIMPMHGLDPLFEHL